MSKQEMPEWLEKQLEDFVDDGMQYGEGLISHKQVAEKCFEILKSRCQCGQPIFADTEDMKSPLCHSCYCDYGIHKINRLEKQLEKCRQQRDYYMSNISETLKYKKREDEELEQIKE